jgi:hypothetical protein
MKTIKYNNKEYKLPFDVELPEDPTVEVEVKNRFTGEATTMPEFAAAVYDAIIGSVRCSVIMIQYVKDWTGSSNTLQNNTW